MRKKSITLLAAFLPALPLHAAEEKKKAAPGPSAHAEALAEFQDWRFGMFIHWGPVSLKGTEIGWSRGRQIPIEEYDRLYQRFNPVEFDAEAWARTAKAAGMKYLVLTAKHHDGFCLWPTAQRPWLSATAQRATPYSIAETPFARDVCGELAEACREHGIAFCTYYSIADWYHFDWTPRHHDPRPVEGADLDRYLPYLKAQCEELIGRYDISVLWFDGEWFDTWTAELGADLYRRLREKKDRLIINNRVGKGRHGMKSGSWDPAVHSGDYDTPEQNIGKYAEVPWETCMTICRQWAWKPDDKMKTLDQCIRTLVSCAGGNGNLLFNVGPMPDGRIEDRQVERLKEMGAWLDRHGESIYGTRGGPIKPGPGFVTTRRGNVVYLHVFADAPDPVELPALPRRIVEAGILGGDEVRIAQGQDSWFVSVPGAVRQPIDTVVKIILDDPVMDLDAIDLPKEFGPAKASNVYRKDHARFGPGKAFDGDPGTRWATDEGTGACRLEAQLAKPVSIRGIEIDEAPDYAGRVEKFVVQVKSGAAWKTVAEGEELGRFRVEFDPVEASALRLEISRANEGPTITEVRILK